MCDMSLNHNTIVCYTHVYNRKVCNILLKKNYSHPMFLLHRRLF
jgi:hypothetical protein